jgi:hypothetical protein
MCPFVFQFDSYTLVIVTVHWTYPSTYEGCRLRLKRDGTHAETRFRLSAKRTSPFKSAVASVQSATGSQGVRISASNAGYTMFRGSVKGTGSNAGYTMFRGSVKGTGSNAGNTMFRGSVKGNGSNAGYTMFRGSMKGTGSNAGYTMFRGSVKSTGYPLHSPVSPSLPLPCVTVCHHISAGLWTGILP